MSLTSICCKVKEHILHSHIMKFFERHHVLSDFQFGFRKNRSCETQLILTINELANGLDNSQPMDGILLDFSMAFLKVLHRRLAAKLHHFDTELLSWQDTTSHPSRSSFLCIASNFKSASMHSPWTSVISSLYQRPTVQSQSNATPVCR